MKKNLLFLFFLIIGFGLHGSTPIQQFENAANNHQISAMGQLLVQNPTLLQNASVQTNIIKAADAQGRTVLIWAVINQNVSLVQALLAIPGIKTNATYINAKADGKTALDYAQGLKNQKIITLLRSQATLQTITLSGLQTIKNNKFSSLQNNQYQNVTINGGLQLINTQLTINGNLTITCTSGLTNYFSLDKNSTLTVFGTLILNGYNAGYVSNAGQIVAHQGLQIAYNQGHTAQNSASAVYNSGTITSYNYISIYGNHGFYGGTSANGSPAVYNSGTIKIPSTSPANANAYVSIVNNTGGSGANGGYGLYNIGTIANNSAGGTYSTTGLPTNIFANEKQITNLGIIIYNNAGGNNTIHTGAGGIGIYNNNHITSINAIYIIGNTGGSYPNCSAGHHYNNSTGGIGTYNAQYIISANGPINISNNVGGNGLLQGGHGFYNNGQVRIKTTINNSNATIFINSNQGGLGCLGLSNFSISNNTNICNAGGNGGYGFYNNSHGLFYAAKAMVGNNIGGNGGDGGYTQSYGPSFNQWGPTPAVSSTTPCPGGNGGYGAININSAGFVHVRPSNSRDLTATTVSNNKSGIGGTGGTQDGNNQAPNGKALGNTKPKSSEFPWW